MVEYSLFDVAVIGGGLAGLCMSIQCADNGYRTILFEKELYPFHKVCGEYISLESRDFLERIGFEFTKMALPIIKTLEISDVSGHKYTFPLPLGGFGISRYTLDNTLYKLALNKNVHVITNCKVQDVQFSDGRFVIDSSCGKYTARVAAGSFGKRSNLDVKFKRPFIRSKPGSLNNYIGVKYHIRYPQPQEVIALHNFKDGYCGISAIEEDKCCLCYLTTARNLKNSANSIKHMESTILSENPVLREIFSSAEFIYSQPLTISQVSFERKSQVEQHILMLGDAAGMITPLCGNGMSMAMHASKIAFNNVNRFLQNAIDRKEMEENYVKEWNQRFNRRLRVGRFIQRLFGAKTTTAIFLKFMNTFPSVAKEVVRMTHGEPF